MRSSRDDDHERTIGHRATHSKQSSAAGAVACGSVWQRVAARGGVWAKRLGLGISRNQYMVSMASLYIVPG